jgi:hypothetical protein
MISNARHTSSWVIGVTSVRASRRPSPDDVAIRSRRSASYSRPIVETVTRPAVMTTSSTPRSGIL